MPNNWLQSTRQDFFTIDLTFEFDVPISAGECAYKLSTLQDIYIKFNRNERNQVEFYVWHRFRVGMTVDLSATIIPSGKTCRIVGVSSYANQMFAWKFMLASCTFTGIFGLLLTQDPLVLVLSLGVPLVIWEVHILQRNQLIETIKSKTGVTAATPIL